MKISQLISELKRLQIEAGDAEVLIYKDSISELAECPWPETVPGANKNKSVVVFKVE